jgi:uncharacterized membrane protein YdjX (TVP38/TMEM64 family)
MTTKLSGVPTWVRWLGLAIALAITLILFKQFHVTDWIQSNLRSALTWVEGLGAIAPIAFIIIYNLATVLLIPGSILTLGGGVLFGIGWGSFYVFIAATLGATIAFWIGRNFARDWVSKQISKYPKFAAIDQAVAKEGFKIVALTRLSPFFPFNLLNYAFGITQVSLRDYILGSIGMIPGTVLYVYAGSLLGNLAQIGAKGQVDAKRDAIQWGVGFLITIGVTLYITRVAKKALDSSIAN